MAERTISTRLILSGESEYRAAVKLINAEMNTLKSALKLVDSEFKGQANSMAALQAKNKALNDSIGKLSEKLKVENDALKKNQDYQKQAAQQIDAVKAKIAEKTAELDKLKKSSDDTTKEEKELTEEIVRLNAELNKSVSAEQAAASAIEKHQTAANKAQTELNKLNGELSQNEKYLDEAKRSADGCATSIDKMGKEVGEAAQESKGFGDKLVGAFSDIKKALAAVGITVALKKIYDAMKACAEASIEFESAMAGVAKTTDLTDVELSAMGDAIKELSTRIPLTTTEIAGIAEVAGQLGVSKENLLAFTEVMANLGVATNMTSEEAATMLAQFAAITGMDTSQYENLGSTIVALGNNFATNERRIADFAQTVAGAGVNAGMSESEMLALGTAVTSLGIEAGVGGSNMSKLITAMQTAVETGEDLEYWAQAAGMSAQDFAYLWGTDATGAILAFIQGVNDTEIPMAKLLDQLGMGEMRTSRMITSMANAEDASGTLSRAMELAETAWLENSALATEASKRYETTESKLQMLSSAFGNFKIAIGDGFTKPLADSSEWLSNLLATLTEIINKQNEASDRARDYADGELFKAAAVTNLSDALALLYSLQEEYDNYIEDHADALSEGFGLAYQEAAAGVVLLAAEVKAAEEAVASFTETEAENAAATAEMGEAAAMSVEEMTASYEALVRQMDELNEAYQKSYDAAYEGISGTLGLFKEISVEYDLTMQNLLNSLDSQIAFMNEYAANIQAAMALGVDEGLIAKLSDGSVESARILAAIVADGGQNVSELNAKLGQVEEGKEEFSRTVAEMETDFINASAGIQTEMSALVSSMNKSGAAASAGASTIGGLISGLNSRIGELQSKVSEINGIMSRVGSGFRYGHASGLEYVPYDEYPANLHKGEMVLTALEARAYRAEQSVNSSVPALSGPGGMGGLTDNRAYHGDTIVENHFEGNFIIREEADIDKISEALAEKTGQIIRYQGGGLIGGRP